MILSNPFSLSSSQFPLIVIANKTGIDANALATTTLDYRNGATAANSIPLFARVTRASGTMLLLVFSIRLNAAILHAVAAPVSALMGGSGENLLLPLNSTTASLTVPNATGNYDVVVGTVNGTASTLNIEIYGIKIS